MNIKQLLTSLLLFVGIASASALSTPPVNQLPDSVYLMAYFTSPAQHLFYAWSVDGLH